MKDNEREQIKVWIDFDRGKTQCICTRSHKLCSKNCSQETVYRLKYDGLRGLFYQDKFGKSKA